MKYNKAKRTVRKWIKHWWGPRCKSFDLDCGCCRAWGAYDMLRSRPSAVENYLDKIARDTQDHRNEQYADSIATAVETNQPIKPIDEILCSWGVLSTWSEIFKRITADTLHDPAEGLPLADCTAKIIATNFIRDIFDKYKKAPEPHFAIAPDTGVDVYFDTETDSIKIHIPPKGSSNFYLFSRINNCCLVELQPSLERIVELIKMVREKT